MSIFKNVVGAFKDAVKAGNDFNPLLDDVLEKLEALHSQGKLDDVLYKAELAWTQEHEAYKAKGIHTDALDSQNDVRALAHFMEVLEQEKDTLNPDVKTEAEQLIDLRDKMQHILGNIIKKGKEE